MNVRSKKDFPILLCLSLFFRAALVSCSCVSDCNASNGRMIPICATDGETYLLRTNETVGITSVQKCLEFGCGLDALNFGSCDCPNHCFVGFGNGLCTSQ